MAAAAWWFMMNDERLVREKIELNKLTDRACETWCRMPRQNVAEICDILPPYLRRRKINGLSVETQVIAALSVLSSGSYQWIGGGNTGLSQASTSRSVERVTSALCSLRKEFIIFPSNNAHLMDVKKGFYNLSKIMNCLGAIDCTHTPITRPSKNSEAYNNRYHTKSVNIQVVCDAATEILDVVAKYPGSCHDSFIWKSSELRSKLENGTITNGWLIGDCGYPLEPWLITPIPEEASEKEAYFNVAHKKARNTIERCFGIMKGRWRCLTRSAGELAYSPQKVLQMFMACAVLHNYCVRRGIPLPEDWIIEEPQQEERVNEQNEEALPICNRIVDTPWSNRRN